MLTRRRFLGHLIGLGGALLPLSAQAIFPEAPSIIRSRPNPHDGHLSLAVAEELCTLNARDQTFGDRCINLKGYSSASVAALEQLAQKEWWFAEFGFTDLTRETTRALASINICCIWFFHIENATAEAVATLTEAWGEVHFKNVLVLDTDGFQKLAGLMSSCGKDEDHGSIELCGTFKVDDALADAIKRLPTEVFLTDENEPFKF